MNLILMGAPGAGKGTQAERIQARYGIPAVSTGEILRGAIKAGTELGKTAKSYVDNGQLVPDDIVIGIVREHLNSDACKNGFILDGFPRSIPQAEAIEALGIKIDAVLSIEVPDETIVERMTGRRVCPKCGASYHTAYIPPKTADVCDKCGTELIVRPDDKPETVLNRLATFHAQTEPLKAFYAERGMLRTVVGQEKVEDTTALVFAALEQA